MFDGSWFVGVAALAAGAVSAGHLDALTGAGRGMSPTVTGITSSPTPSWG